MACAAWEGGESWRIYLEPKSSKNYCRLISVGIEGASVLNPLLVITLLCSSRLERDKLEKDKYY